MGQKAVLVSMVLGAVTGAVAFLVVSGRSLRLGDAPEFQPLPAEQRGGAHAGPSTDPSATAGDEPPAPGPVDHQWARVSEQALRSAFEQKRSTQPYRVAHLECHVSSCVVTLQWPSFEAARSSYAELPLRNGLEGCGGSILLPEPSDPTLPYEARLVFQCGSQRAG